MQSPEKTYRKRMWVLFGCAIPAIFLAVFASARGALPPRGLPVIIVLIWAGLTIGILMLVRAGRNDARKQREFLGASSPEFAAITNERQMRLIRSAKRMIAFFVIALVFGLWTSRAQPLFPRAVGASFDLLMIGWLAWSIFKVRKATGKTSDGEPGNNS